MENSSFYEEVSKTVPLIKEHSNNNDTHMKVFEYYDPGVKIG